MQQPENLVCTELIPVKISSPTCEDLGIPNEADEICLPIFPPRMIKNPSLHIDGIRYEATLKGYSTKIDPYSPICMIPLPFPLGGDHAEPNFVRRRNERERDRVKCVNEGYQILKEHLPIERKNKRVSKVEILRFAIDYIKHLRDILNDTEDTDNKSQCNESVVKIEHPGSESENSQFDIKQKDPCQGPSSTKRQCVRSA